ncbi:unnamed protein product, partial [Callosobruchus maculatus]
MEVAAQSEKQLWEERASRLNEETKATMMNVAAAAAAAAGEDPCGSPQPQMPPQDQVYECLWDTCDYQFEDTIDLIEHCIKDRDQPSHVTAFFQENPGLEFHCHWRNCARNRKNPQPFPNATRLIRHIRDMHINKGNGRSVPPDKRSQKFVSSSRVMPVLQPAVSKVVAAGVVGAGSQQAQMQVKVAPSAAAVAAAEAIVHAAAVAAHGTVLASAAHSGTATPPLHIARLSCIVSRSNSTE